jgi:hypothetical protein
MRSFSEMLIAIAVSLVVISAIYVARHAFLSSDLPPLPAVEKPAVSIMPPREVKASAEDALIPPAPAAAVVVSPLASPPGPALGGPAEVEALHL